MGSNPYQNLPERAFWKTGVATENPFQIREIYTKKFEISSSSRIATAGSCFAQHISRQLRSNDFNLLDVEPAPDSLPAHAHQSNGYSMYSARYGNIYTVRQLLQLVQEAAGIRQPSDAVWLKNERFYDALRPAVEPNGLSTADEVIAARSSHLAKVRELLHEFDVFVFTLGLTQSWIHRSSGTVYPTAPGTIAGEYDATHHVFHDASVTEILSDFEEFQTILNSIRKGRPYKVVLTVSPVPLTATANNNHVLVANAHSKAVLRTAAGQLTAQHDHIDYFPSYEIVTNPRLHSTAFADNLRSIRPEVVDIVMRHFFDEHQGEIKTSAIQGRATGRRVTGEKIKKDRAAEVTPKQARAKRFGSAVINDNIMCEEEILEEFSKHNIKDDESIDNNAPVIHVIGNSYIAAFRQAMSRALHEAANTNQAIKANLFYYPAWGILRSHDLLHLPFSQDDLREKYKQNFNRFSTRPADFLCFIGYRLMGNQIFQTLMKGCAPEKDKRVNPLGFELPFIQHESECPDFFHEDLKLKAKKAKRSIDIYISLLGRENFRWVSEPIMPENAARSRFGDAYVDSGSQVVYNRIADEIHRKVLGSYIDQGVLILHPQHLLTEHGFSRTEFSEGQRHPEINLHPNQLYYSDSVQALISQLRRL